MFLFHNNSSNKLILITIYLFILTLYLLLYFINPAGVITELFKLKINYPDNLNNFIFKISNFSILLCSVIFLFLVTKNSPIYIKIKLLIEDIILKISRIISIKTLISLSVVYLIVLFFIAIKNYDLGFDEAWYLNYARNFQFHFFPYYVYDGGMALISITGTISNILFSLINFKLGLTEVWHFKLLSSFLSITSLFLIYTIIYKLYNKNLGLIFLFLIIIQPGFGFVASSFFGEIIAVCLIFIAAYYWFKNGYMQNRNLLLIGLFLSLAIHIKLQLLPLLIITLIIYFIFTREKPSLMILMYMLLLVTAIALIHLIPVLLYDDTLLVKIVEQFYHLSTSYNKGFSVRTIERIQLFNRFFPVFIFSSFAIFSITKLKNGFEKFIYIFSVLSILWWTFSFSFSTYRHLFIGLIPFLFIIAKTVIDIWDNYLTKNISNKGLLSLKYISGVFLLILMFYGFSTNIIYAYVGYNDGVQLDLDGYKSRLFKDIRTDTTQKKFYSNIKNYITQNDTLFTGAPFLTCFYLPNNTVLSYKKLEEILSLKNRSCYVIISREFFPLDISKGREFLNNLNIKSILILKEGDFELYKVVN